MADSTHFRNWCCSGLVLVDRDFVITLSEIAYNVNNNLDEVLLAIVFTVHNGNIFNRSCLVLKLSIHVRVVETTRQFIYSRLVSYFHISC